MTHLIPKDFYPIISDYAKVLIPSLITYFVTRYTLNRPHKYTIREKQFNQVYLPLYLLSKQLLDNYKHVENLNLFIKKAEKIIYKNYQFVFPKTEKLLKKLKAETYKETINSYHLANWESQINSDYEKLKRELGYPTNSLLDFFKRLSFLNKILYGFLVLSFALSIYLLISIFLMFIHGDIVNALWNIVALLIISFFMYLLTYIMRH